jgi:hypothetical protein
MPIMRRQLSIAARTVNPGGCLLSEEELAMIVLADAASSLRFAGVTPRGLRRLRAYRRRHPCGRRRINADRCASASKQHQTPVDECVAMREPNCFT